MTGRHQHDPSVKSRAFAAGFGFNLGFVVLEVIAGVLTGSLALLADAAHNLSDVLGLLASWGAVVLSRRRPSRRYTYGLRRTTILAALFNAVILLVAVGALSLEAIERLASPPLVSGAPVMIVAGIGALINAGTAALFFRGGAGDLNVRAAFLHMAADALVSLGVVVAGAVIHFTGATWIDPLTTLIIVVVIAWATWGLLTQSLKLAVDAVPENIESDAVERYLRNIEGVAEIHDLHIWAMSTTEASLTAHLVVPELDHDDRLLDRVSEGLRREFGIGHATVQVERGGKCDSCRDLPAVSN